jgi:hypothetical protein
MAVPPELIVIAQQRPGVFRPSQIASFRERAPLASLLSLLGTWCEGETRTGRPLAGTHRVYWHEFPAWWRRQMEQLAQGGCPDWALPGYETDSCKPWRRNPSDGLRTGTADGRLALAAAHWEAGAVLGDLLRQAGYTTTWQPPGRAPTVGDSLAGIWDGGQLDANELRSLTVFCQHLAGNNAPVIALLDFPRFDACERARKAGAAVILGKPWNNAALVGTVRWAIQQAQNGLMKKAA